MKSKDLDVLEEKSEKEEDGDKLTKEGFYKSMNTVENNTLTKIRKAKQLPPK